MRLVDQRIELNFVVGSQASALWSEVGCSCVARYVCRCSLILKLYKVVKPTLRLERSGARWNELPIKPSNVT